MDQTVYEQACTVSAPKMPATRNARDRNNGRGALEVVNLGTDATGQPETSTDDAARRNSPGGDTRSAKQSRFWTGAVIKTISVLSFVLNCCLLGAVIFLTFAMLDLKLSVSQLDEKMEMATAKLTNISGWMEQVMGNPMEGFEELGVALPKTTTGLTQLTSPDLPTAMENDTMLDEKLLSVEELEVVTVLPMEPKMSDRQASNKTNMTTAANPENVDGKLEQPVLYNVTTEMTGLSAPGVPSTTENNEMIHNEAVKLAAPCPNGYQKYGEVCYKAFGGTPKTFSDSSTTCQADGGTLAMPRDAGINGFLISLTKKYRAADFWFGLHDQRHEGQWKWMDGTALGTGYTAWAAGEPNNQHDDQHCAMYWGAENFQWDDDMCCRKHGFLCQFKPPDAKGN